MSICYRKALDVYMSENKHDNVKRPPLEINLLYVEAKLFLRRQKSRDFMQKRFRGCNQHLVFPLGSSFIDRILTRAATNRTRWRAIV